MIFNNREPTWQTCELQVVPGNRATFSFYYGRASARISDAELDAAANWLALFQSNESKLRQQTGKSLVDGGHKELDLPPNALRNDSSGEAIADEMRLVSVEMFADSTGWLTYDLLDLKSHSFRGGHQVRLWMSPEFMIDETTLAALPASRLASLFLQRSTALGSAACEIDSPADQIVSTFAYQGWLKWDENLRALVAKCVGETQLRSNRENGATKRHLDLLVWILQQIEKEE